jgi:ABC-type branched-subunit amino acid transport system substrate-binding protein
MKAAVRGIFVVVAVLLTLNSSVWAEIGVTDNEIVVGSCSVLTGPAMGLGTEQLKGARAFLKEVNEKGGIHGRKIKLLEFDDRYSPDGAVECFQKLLDNKVFAAAFFVGTPTAAKHAPLVEQAKLPAVGWFTGAQLLHEPFKRYVLNIRASYYDETREFVDGVWNSLGYRKIGVIYQDDAFGAAVLAGVKRGLKKYNAEPVAIGSFQRGSLEVDSAIEQVKAGNPEAVSIVGPYASVAEVVKRSRAKGWTPLFHTVSFVGTGSFIKAGGKEVDGTVITQVVPPVERKDLPLVAHFLKNLEKYEPGAVPDFVPLEGFVDAYVLVEGIKRAGKDLTREKFIAALEGMKNMDIGLGAQLKLDYGPQDHTGFDTVYYTVVREGKAVTFDDWKALKKR